MFNKLVKNRVVWAIVSIVLACIVGFVIVPTAANRSTNTVDVLVATEDIPVGQIITETMFEKHAVDVSVATGDYFTNERNLVGQYAIKDIFKGTFITTAQVASTMNTDGTIRNMKIYERFVTINRKDMVSTSLLPNDIIAIRAINSDGAVSNIPELEYIRVCSVTASNGTPIVVAGQRNENGATLAVENIGLILTINQEAVLHNIMGNGQVYISLVYRGTDTMMIEDYVAAQDTYLKNKYPSTYYDDTDIEEEE